MGVPNASILMEVKSDSTLDNAVFSKEEVMLDHKLESAIVVSSNSHMRRVKVLYDKTFQNSDIRLTYVAGDRNVYNPKRWWVEESNRDITIREYIKLVGNLFPFHGSEFTEEFFGEVGFVRGTEVIPVQTRRFKDRNQQKRKEIFYLVSYSKELIF